MRPIRRFMPNLGGIDLSPIVALLAIYMIEIVLSEQHRIVLLKFKTPHQPTSPRAILRKQIPAV